MIVKSGKTGLHWNVSAKIQVFFVTRFPSSDFLALVKIFEKKINWELNLFFLNWICKLILTFKVFLNIYLIKYLCILTKKSPIIKIWINLVLKILLIIMFLKSIKNINIPLTLKNKTYLNKVHWEDNAINLITWAFKVIFNE